MVTSRQLSSPTQEHRDNPLKYRPVPGRSRHGHGHAHAHAPSNEAGPSSPRRTSHDVQLQSTPPVVYDITSMHGEQGYDWGEDESNFEWVDTDNAPEAANGDGKGHKTSPSKKLGKIKAAMSAGPGAHIPFEMRNESKKLKKQLVFPRRAPPPPPPGIAPHPNSPRSQSFSFSPAISHPTTLKPQVGLFSNLTVPDPRRPSFTRRAESERPPSGPNDLLRTTSTPVPSPDPSQASPAIPSQPELPTRPGPSPLMPTLMVPIKETDGSNAGSSKDDAQRYSQMSFQSAAYSFYDLESPGPSTPGAVTPTQARFDQTQQVEAGPSGDIGPRASVFPYGTYRKVSVSQLEREKETRDRDMSLPETRSPHFDADEEDHPPEFFIAKGIEARAKGNLPRSAWYFMKAAEKGSPTGRMYWGMSIPLTRQRNLTVGSGLSLRHGFVSVRLPGISIADAHSCSWGVARDDKKAFVELRQACDDSLFEGGVNFHQSPGTVKLSLQQKKSMTVSLSLATRPTERGDSHVLISGTCLSDCSRSPIASSEALGSRKLLMWPCRTSASLATWAILPLKNVSGNVITLCRHRADSLSSELGFLLSKGGNGVKKDM